MIRVRSAEAVTIPFRLVEGYRIAGRHYDTAENVILKVDTADGRTGFGCAAPAEDVTGETIAACAQALRDRLIPILRACNADDVEGVARRAAEAAPHAPAARAAAEMALLDLRGLRAGVPLVRLLGMRRGRLPTSVTLGIDDPRRTLERARRYVNQGFFILKVKLGEDWEAEARLVRALKEAFGGDVILRADGNEGYSEDAARRFLAAIAPGDLELLEQPTPAGDLEALRRLDAAGPVPIMADEAVIGEADAEVFARTRAARLVNIKLMKCGGALAARGIARRAWAAGIGAMIGCNDESRIGIAAALHCALSEPGIGRIDLDGHLDLADDVAAGGVRIVRGYALPLFDRPGLGVTVTV